VVPVLEVSPYKDVDSHYGSMHLVLLEFVGRTLFSVFHEVVASLFHFVNVLIESQQRQEGLSSYLADKIGTIATILLDLGNQMV
jgi:hypothetical protein